MQGSGRKKEMRVTAAFRLGDKENDDLVSFSSRIVKRVRGHPLSTYAPRGRGGGGPKAYVVREVA